MTTLHKPPKRGHVSSEFSFSFFFTPSVSFCLCGSPSTSPALPLQSAIKGNLRQPRTPRSPLPAVLSGRSRQSRLAPPVLLRPSPTELPRLSPAALATTFWTSPLDFGPPLPPTPANSRPPPPAAGDAPPCRSALPEAEIPRRKPTRGSRFRDGGSRRRRW